MREAHRADMEGLLSAEPAQQPSPRRGSQFTPINPPRQPNSPRNTSQAPNASSGRQIPTTAGLSTPQALPRATNTASTGRPQSGQFLSPREGRRYTTNSSYEPGEDGETTPSSYEQRLSDALDEPRPEITRPPTRGSASNTSPPRLPGSNTQRVRPARRTPVLVEAYRSSYERGLAEVRERQLAAANLQPSAADTPQPRDRARNQAWQPRRGPNDASTLERSILGLVSETAEDSDEVSDGQIEAQRERNWAAAPPQEEPPLEDAAPQQPGPRRPTPRKTAPNDKARVDTTDSDTSGEESETGGRSPAPRVPAPRKSAPNDNINVETADADASEAEAEAEDETGNGPAAQDNAGPEEQLPQGNEGEGQDNRHVTGPRGRGRKPGPSPDRTERPTEEPDWDVRRFYCSRCLRLVPKRGNTAESIALYERVIRVSATNPFDDMPCWRETLLTDLHRDTRTQIAAAASPTSLAVTRNTIYLTVAVGSLTLPSETMLSD